MKLTLYTGPECHLCDLAKDELALIDDPCLEVNTKNIREDTHLYHLYAVRIPVLKRHDNDEELNWPFSHHELRRFIQ